MALTAFREQNQAKWVGTRPGHNGEQIDLCSTLADTTAVIYTVPANKILLVNAISSYSRNLAGANAAGYAAIDDGGVLQFIVGYYSSASDVPFGDSICFPIPFEMVEDWRFIGYSDNANLLTLVSIHGILIDT